jgi:hypothetical protein
MNTEQRQTRVQPAKPQMEKITIDESGSDTADWICEENKSPSDASLRAFVLVGSAFED